MRSRAPADFKILYEISIVLKHYLPLADYLHLACEKRCLLIPNQIKPGLRRLFFFLTVKEKLGASGVLINRTKHIYIYKHTYKNWSSHISLLDLVCVVYSKEYLSIYGNQTESRFRKSDSWLRGVLSLLSQVLVYQETTDTLNTQWLLYKCQLGNSNISQEKNWLWYIFSTLLWWISKT